MHIITTQVSPDEPCMGLKEGPVNGRWLQQVFVVRGDAIAKHETDLGPAENFESVIVPMAIIGFGDDTVGECMEAAVRNRADFYWRNRAREMQEQSTLMRDIVRQREMIHEAIHNRTISGPYQTTQRNGYSRVTTQRQLIEKKRERTGKVQK